MMDFVDEFYADKDLSLLKKMTLIIPTYDRNYSLSRCLWYHAHFPFGQIIVADSSPEEKKVVNRETVAKIRERFGANILYMEYEDIETKYGEHISKKWLDAIKHVETEFTHFCADKDFVVPTTIVEDICFLEDNDGYTISSAGWESIILVNSNTKSCNFMKSYSHLQSCLDENPCDRLNNSLAPKFKGYVYCTFRTQTLHVLSDLMNQYNVFDLGYGEVMYTVVPILYGKFMCRSNTTAYIRDMSKRHYIKGYTKESTASRYPNFLDYERDPSLEYFYVNFKKCVSNTICNVSDLKIDEAEKFVDTNVRKAILAIHKKHYLSMLLSKMGRSSCVHELWCRTPKSVRRTGNLIATKLLHHHLSVGDLESDENAVYSSDKSHKGIICNLIVTTVHLYDDDAPIDILHFNQ